MKIKNLVLLLSLVSIDMTAQSVMVYTSTDGNEWAKSKASLSKKADGDITVNVSGEEDGTEFKAWGTTFNELDWDAFNLLTRDEQDEVMRRIFSADGDLRFTHGRVSMNANDYSRAWYSCDEVDGDFGLKYFNIEHDKRNIIPLARAAQKYCPQLQLFMSPWCPPTWMKINHDYPVSPNRTNEMDELMYQNEAYSCTPYPGCAWTAEGTLRFNNEYLAPTLKKRHPEVELWIKSVY